MILDDIVQAKRETIEEDVQTIMPKETGKIAQLMRAKKDLFVIGEIKKASPSKGVIVDDFSPIELAYKYDEADIDALSILTEKNYFLGDLKFLEDVGKNSKTPLLRKDFIIDVREIIQAKQAGASLILLIVAILDDAQLQSFYQVAYAIGLECIVEVHSEEELQRALAISPEIIGINNRNLSTFEVDIQTTKRLRASIPQNIVVVSESGIHNHEDIKLLQSVGVDGVLIGESFMRCKDISAHLKSLLHGV